MEKLTMKMKQPLSFWKKLQRLIEKMPEGCSLAYDEEGCILYMLKPNPKFSHGQSVGVGSGLPGNMSEGQSFKPRSGGYQPESLVSDDFIDVDLARLDF